MVDYIQEEWKPVVGYEGLYEVSSHGRVRRIETGVIYAGYISQRYLAVTLTKNKRPKCKRVHILVADAFLGPCPARKERNHIDGNRFNNRVSNIEYVTRQENVRHAQQLGLRKDWSTPRKLNEEQVAEIRSLYRRGTARQVGKRFGVSKNCINDIISGKTWSG